MTKLEPGVTGKKPTSRADLRSACPHSARAPPSTALEPFAVKAKEARRLLGDIGVTHFYEILHELESYREGRNRMVLMRSIKARIDRLLQAQAGERRDTSEIAAKSAAVQRARRKVQR